MSILGTMTGVFLLTGLGLFFLGAMNSSQWAFGAAFGISFAKIVIHYEAQESK